MAKTLPAVPPAFSLVTAVYNVARYLGDFIASIDSQEWPSEQLEVIAVDDGSTDDSLAILNAWAARSAYRVTVLTKPNGGQGSARNLGMTHASGTWMTFPDPDDILAPGYLASVQAFIDAHPNVEMVATNRIFLDESSGNLRDGHPLRKLFRETRAVNLDRFPEFFHGSAPAAFMRTQVLRDSDLTFDERIRPNFEDGHLCARYLMAAPSRWVGFVREAHYHYRKRADLSSTLQNSVRDPRRYTHVPEFGYLSLLQLARDRFGSVPEWVQNMVVYELSWYFSAEDAPSGSGTAALGAAADHMHRVMGQILGLIDPETIQAHNVRHLRPVWRDALLHGWDDQSWHTPYVVVDRTEPERGLVRMVYRYTGSPPTEEFLMRGLPIEPTYSKVRAICYFDRQVMHERIAWVNCRGTLRVRLAGRPVAIRDSWEPPLPLARYFASRSQEDSAAPPHRSLLSLATEAWRSRASRDPVVQARRAMAESRDEFRDAWVLVDRVHNSDDSAEVLFRYLRRRRPEINAWFTVEEGTADWDRLVRDGFGDRLVAWGSLRWKALLGNCAFLISSHIDAPIHHPAEIHRFTRPTWKFVFLQHGIIKDDLSNWLNTKELALFITSTQDEYASIAGDGTRYVFTTKEVRNTGLPRFDQLLAQGAKYPPERRDMVLVAPTWRHWLTPPTTATSQRRRLHEGFWSSEYARSWLGLLQSEALRDVVQGRGLRLGFLPHPNLQGILEDHGLPDHVTPLPYEGVDVRDYFARAAALTTDYSSMAFNAAYLDRPVTYFQFDAERMFTGDHVGRAGYFQYETHGLGPVAYDLDQAVGDLIAAIENGPDPAPEYAGRIAATFPTRDGKVCARVTSQIEGLLKPLTRRQLNIAVAPPVPATRP